MKKVWNHRLFIPVILVFIYLASLFLGAIAVSAYPVYFKQKRYFTSQAQRIAQELPAGTEDALQHMTGPNMRIFICDAEGNCVRHIPPSNSPPDTKPGIFPDRYLSAVLAGKEVYTAALSQETQRELNDIMIVTGVPIWEDGSITGAVILIRNLMDLPEAILGFVVYFTILYWISAYFVVSNIYKKRKLDKLQQNYIANVTHAFKTPIASIKALAETLCDGVEPDPDRQKVYYGMILREANRQDHMIRDVLNLSKLQSSGMDFTKTAVRAAGVFAPVLEKYAALCDCRDITLHISEELSRLPPLRTNAACLKQLLELLLDNALKFTPEGGDIWVETSLSRKQTVFCVRDNGVGIAKETLPHVFERFFKGSHDFNESGSGLGLAIAREIAAGLKERIWAESEPGRGAAFYFTVHLRNLQGNSI